MTASIRIAILLGFLATASATRSPAQDNVPSAARVTGTQPTKRHASPNDGQPTKIVHGVVVDEMNAPVAKINVSMSSPGGLDPSATVVTDDGGKFEFVAPEWRTFFHFGAADPSGERLGFLMYESDRSRAAEYPSVLATGPVPRIVLHAARPIAVTVVDDKERPVAAAKIGLGFKRDSLRSGQYEFVERLTAQVTDAAGKAVVHVPSDLPLACVFAVKAGSGFDYASYGPVDDPTGGRMNRRRPGKRVANSPGGPNEKQVQTAKTNDPDRHAADDRQPINLVLSGVHIMRMHLVDEHHRPLKGVKVRVGHIQRPHRGGPAVLPPIAEFQLTTDAAGIARCDAIPIETSPVLLFSSASKSYPFIEQPNFDPTEHTTDFELVATSLPVVRVQVTDADGRPALGSQIRYASRRLLGGSRAAPGATGTATQLSPEGCELPQIGINGAYFVVSAAKGPFASTITACVLRMGDPVRTVKLVLRPATRVHGTLTIGKERRPGANQPVTLIQRDDDNYSKLPEDERLPRVRHLAMDIPFLAITDDQGRFEFNAAPGPYVIGIGRVALFALAAADKVEAVFRDRPAAFEINDQKEIPIDLHCDRTWSPDDAPRPQMTPIRMRPPGQ
jgi:hypothetical protein